MRGNAEYNFKFGYDIKKKLFVQDVPTLELFKIATKIVCESVSAERHGSPCRYHGFEVPMLDAANHIGHEGDIINTNPPQLQKYYRELCDCVGIDSKFIDKLDEVIKSAEFKKSDDTLGRLTREKNYNNEWYDCLSMQYDLLKRALPENGLWQNYNKFKEVVLFVHQVVKFAVGMNNFIEGLGRLDSKIKEKFLTQNRLPGELKIYDKILKLGDREVRFESANRDARISFLTNVMPVKFSWNNDIWFAVDVARGSWGNEVTEEDVKEFVNMERAELLEEGIPDQGVYKKIYDLYDKNFVDVGEIDPIARGWINAIVKYQGRGLNINHSQNTSLDNSREVICGLSFQNLNAKNNNSVIDVKKDGGKIGNGREVRNDLNVSESECGCSIF